MANFEESLLDHLKQHAPDPNSALPGRSLRVPAALAGVALAATGALVLPTLGADPATAHAVTKRPDGTVSISLRDLHNVDAANRELRDLGIGNIVIIAMRPPGTCRPQDRLGPAVRNLDVFDPPAAERKIVNVRPKAIPPNHTAVVMGDVQDPHRFVTAEMAVVPTQAHYCAEFSRYTLPPPRTLDPAHSTITVSTLPKPPH